jgi:hypothetical protein
MRPRSIAFEKTIYATLFMRPAEYLNNDPTGMVEAGHGPVVKSDGVTRK